MKYHFICLLCCFSAFLSGQGLTLRNKGNNSIKTMKAGKTLKLTTASFTHADHMLQTYQTVIGELLQTAHDSVYLRASGVNHSGRNNKGQYKSSYKFNKDGHLQIAIAKRDILQVQKVNMTKKTLFVVSMVGLFAGVSSLVSSAIVHDKSGGARLLKVGTISLGSALVLGITSSPKRFKINSLDCESPWVVE